MFYNNYRNWEIVSPEEDKKIFFEGRVSKEEPPKCRCDSWELLHGDGCRCEYKAWLEKKKKQKEEGGTKEAQRRKDDCISRLYRYGD